MIGCRAPARGTDTDHTLDHARGGATVEYNLGNTCKHDHRVKHEGGWQLHQPEPGQASAKAPTRARLPGRSAAVLIRCMR